MIYYIPSISISSKCKITLNISDAKKNVLFQGICDKSLQCMDLLSTLAEYIKQLHDNIKY